MNYLESYGMTNDYNFAMILSEKNPVKGLIFYLRSCWPKNGPLRNAFEDFLKDNRSTTVLKGICNAGMNHLGTKMNLVSTYLFSEGYMKHIRH